MLNNANIWGTRVFVSMVRYEKSRRTKQHTIYPRRGNQEHKEGWRRKKKGVDN